MNEQIVQGFLCFALLSLGIGCLSWSFCAIYDVLKIWRYEGEQNGTVEEEKSEKSP